MQSFSMSSERRRKTPEIEFEGDAYVCVRKDEVALYAKRVGDAINRVI